MAPVPKAKPDPFAESDRIVLFETLVIVRAGGTLWVKEKIKVYNGDGDKDNTDPEYLAVGGGNDKIKRGILRNFPTKYTDRYKLFRNTTFKLQEVSMDEKRVTWKLHNDFGTNGYTLQIGDPYNTLSTGYHTYTITYSTEHQVKFQGL